MKTPYNEIVNIASIGSQTNPISLNEILAMYVFITPISQYRLMEISEYIRTRNRHLKILSAKPYRRIAV